MPGFSQESQETGNQETFLASGVRVRRWREARRPCPGCGPGPASGGAIELARLGTPRCHPQSPRGRAESWGSSPLPRALSAATRGCEDAAEGNREAGRNEASPRGCLGK